MDWSRRAPRARQRPGEAAGDPAALEAKWM